MTKNIVALDYDKLKEILEDRLASQKIKSLKDMPPPQSLKDIQKASQLIISHIQKNSSITIVGDYDVDGVVASAILKEFFVHIKKDVQVIIPNRFVDGYGLSLELAQKISSDLIITVDNGISSLEAVEFLRSNNKDVIITDHHICPETLPRANAIVNPKQKDCPFLEKNIAGATVAWYLVAMLNQDMNAQMDVKSLLDIMSFAIIADAMPLVSINRTLVKSGVFVANQNNRPCILAIKKMLNMPILTSSLIAFSVNPRLNSAGRMQDAKTALDFILAKTEQKALEYLQELDSLNTERKNIEATILQKAKNMINENDPILLAWGNDWHEGVIGIVAARLTELYFKPCIIFSVKDEIARGSARSKDNINLLDLIKTVEDKLDAFGGHKNAAGMSIRCEHLQEFKATITQNVCTNKDYDEFSDVLGELNLSQINMELVELIQSFEPFGEKFKEPYFYIQEIVPFFSKQIGPRKNHTIFKFANGKKQVDAIWFNHNFVVETLSPLSFTFSIAKNTFKGETKPQLIIKQMIFA